MNINPAISSSRVNVATALSRSYAANAAAATSTPGPSPRGDDRVEFSSQAQAVQPSAATPQSQAVTGASDAPVRLDLVQRVRAEIADGTYDTQIKLVIAAREMRRDLIQRG